MKKVCTDCRYPVGRLPICPFCECTETYEVCLDCNAILSYAPSNPFGFCTNCAFIKAGEENAERQ